MKYELIGKNNYLSNDIRKEILKNRGVNDVYSFLNLTDNVFTNPYKFKNMDIGVKKLIEHIENDSDIWIIEDADPDGITATTILYKYLKSVFPNVNLNYIVHNSRIHGIILDELEEIIENIDLLIVPDGGSENYKEHKLLKNMGIDIIVIDHHPVKIESEDAIIINNQISNISVNLCGAAMVHKFCKALDEELWEDKADNYLDLVALGLISDMMNLSDLEVQLYIRKGLNNIKNKAFKSLLDAQSFSTNGIVNPSTISFYITPTINSVFRFATKEDYELMLRSFLELDEDKVFIYEPKRGKNKGEQIEETIQEHMARMCISYNGKRKRASEKLIKEINKDNKVNFDDKILVIDIGEEYGKKGMTRLIANGFSRQYNKPTIAYYESHEHNYKGSMAANTGNFKNKLNETDIFEFVAGHQNASGLQIKQNKISTIREELNEKFKDEIFEKIHYVDFVIPFEEFDEMGDVLIQDICSLNDYFGKDFEQPYIIIKDVKIPVDKINLLGKEKKETLKMETENLSYIKFKVNEEEYSNLVDWKEYCDVDILGRCSINEYNGGLYPQITIEDWIIRDNNDNSNVDDSWDNDLKNNSEKEIIIKSKQSDEWEW